MIPRIHKSGTSFKAAVAYITHDPDKAKTAERVGWTHTLNCVNDHVPSAVHEMYLVWRDAELLKEEAGIRAGGQPLRFPVKHFSLSWDPSEHPTRGEMITAANSYLKHMGWDEHQCILAVHNDTDHAHLHAILNAVHPQTGLKLDEGRERDRTRDWGLEYELSRGKVFCKQRLLPLEDRLASPPRNVWAILKGFEGEHDQAEAARRGMDAQQSAALPRDPVDAEWKALKAFHQEERQAFFAGGKQAYRDLCKAVYREVREEFREQWAEFYAAKRDGLEFETLAEIRAGILDEQNMVLGERQKLACATLRQERDLAYDDILATQRSERHTLHERQSDGLASPEMLATAEARVAEMRDAANENGNGRDVDRKDDPTGWRDAAREVTAPGQDRETGEKMSPAAEPTSAENPRVKDGLSGLGDIGSGLIEGLSVISERLFDGFFGADVDPAAKKPAPPKNPEPEPEFPPPDLHRRQAEASRREADEEAQKKRDRAFWDERKRGRDR